jgi:hypothetical protein
MGVCLAMKLFAVNRFLRRRQVVRQILGGRQDVWP